MTWEAWQSLGQLGELYESPGLQWAWLELAWYLGPVREAARDAAGFLLIAIAAEQGVLLLAKSSSFPSIPSHSVPF